MPTPKDDEEEIRKKDAIATKLVLGEFFFIASMCLVVPARAPMVLEMKKGDAVSTAKVLGLMSSTGAFLELFINPVFGQLSDMYGRRPFLLLAPVVNCLLHGAVSVFPTDHRLALPLNFADRMISGCMSFTFIAPLTAALSDLFEGPKLAQYIAGQGAAFGLALGVGPFIGAKLAGAKAFAGSAALLGLTGAYIATLVPETMKKGESKKFNIAACSPVRFVKLFKTRTLSTLITTLALQSFGDYWNIYDLNYLYLKTVIPNFGQQQVGNFASACGSTMFLCGYIMKNAIQVLGQKSATLMGNSTYALAMALLGTARTIPQIGAAVFFMAFGHLRNSAISAYVIKHGESQGMGKAEIIGAQGNFLAVLKVLIPVFYGNLYAWATSNGRKMPGAPYLFITVVNILAQLCLWTCDPDKEPAKSS